MSDTSWRDAKAPAVYPWSDFFGGRAWGRWPYSDWLLLNSWRGLCRFGGFVGNADKQGKYTSVLGTDSNIRVALTVNSCSYTHCVSLFPTLHTNRHSPRRESTSDHKARYGATGNAKQCWNAALDGLVQVVLMGLIYGKPDWIPAPYGISLASLSCHWSAIATQSNQIICTVSTASWVIMMIYV